MLIDKHGLPFTSERIQAARLRAHADVDSFARKKLTLATEDDEAARWCCAWRSIPIAPSALAAKTPCAVSPLGNERDPDPFLLPNDGCCYCGLPRKAHHLRRRKHS